MKRFDEITVKELNQRNRVLARLELVLHAATDDNISLIDAGDEIIIDHGDGTAQKARGSYDDQLSEWINRMEKLCKEHKVIGSITLRDN